MIGFQKTSEYSTRISTFFCHFGHIIINIQNQDRKMPKIASTSQAFEWLEHLNAEQEMSRCHMNPI